jgi:2-amino-4-hydroxy-6-hydroxymethyldihydropteridine diphosphokinase
MTTVILALGSNLGDRAGNLRGAIAALSERGAPAVARSSIWETEPVPAGQPAFLNAVIAVETTLGPEELLGVIQDVEHALGRRPNRHWGPRPIDIDILFHGSQQVETSTLRVPHPRIAHRAFVLAPLSEVANGVLPVLGKTSLELLERAERGGIRRTGERL